MTHFKRARYRSLFLGEAVEESIELLRKHEPANGYYGCFSGGKDSIVLKALAAMAGLRVQWYYNPVIDAPETLRFIRSYHPDVIWTKPKQAMFSACVKSGMPGPWFRICCAFSKEAHGRDRVKLLGVRAQESPRRAQSWNVAQRLAVAPMLYWSSDDVWSFIDDLHLPYPALYDQGFQRVGCVGCPLADQPARERDFNRWPRYERFWQRMCRRLWETHSNDLPFIARQKDIGFNCWQDHWAAWRGDMRAYLRGLKVVDPAPCGDNDLTRFMQ